MEPKIQYAKTSDGVSIAFSVTGGGFPLVHVGWGIYSHLEMQWRIPEFRDWYQGLAGKRKLIWYDSRGTGLSERDVSDYSLDGRVHDVSAVVDHLGLERFRLVGVDAALAVTYTARNPERVSHLVLWSPVTLSSDYESRAMAVRSLAGQDWRFYAETAAEWAGISAPESKKLMTEMVRDGSPDTYRLVVAAEWDLTTLLSSLRCKTLVLHRRGNQYLKPGTVQRVAAAVPGAQLVVLEGSEWWPGAGAVGSVLSAIDEFLGEGEEAAPASEPPEASAFRTVLFTDVEGSTALTDRLGDAKARELLREHERMVREALKSHGGSEVKTLGDGFMASFSSATRALECAIAIQSAFAERNESAEEPIKVRIGLNAGEPIAEDDPGGRGDLFGTAVNMAARIASKADAGEILVADVVRQLVAGKEFLFNDRGETELRGFEDPVRVYEVRWREGD